MNQSLMKIKCNKCKKEVSRQTYPTEQVQMYWCDKCVKDSRFKIVKGIVSLKKE